MTRRTRIRNLFVRTIHDIGENMIFLKRILYINSTRLRSQSTIQSGKVFSNSHILADIVARATISYEYTSNSIAFFFYTYVRMIIQSRYVHFLYLIKHTKALLSLESPHSWLFINRQNNIRQDDNANSSRICIYIDNRRQLSDR